MVEIALSVPAIVAEYCVVSIARPFRYIWNYKTNLDNLKTAVRKLEGQRNTVQHSVEEANGEQIEQQVSDWLESVKKIIDEASEVTGENEQVDIKCFHRLCPNPKKRYQCSRNVAKKAKAIVNLYAEGDFKSLSYETIPEEIWLPSLIKGYEAFESRMSTSKDILCALSDPDVKMVGVYGPGGIGKTMLVKEVSRQPKVKELFDRIVFVEVSKMPNIKNIQEEIGKELGLKFSMESESDIATALCARLKKENKILLILDDIWGRLSLDRVGIPFGEDHKGCKLLLTARNQDILKNKMGSQSNFCINVLKEEEAWSLFKKTLGNYIEENNLESMAKDVANACRGVPKVIVTKAIELTKPTSCGVHFMFARYRN